MTSAATHIEIPRAALPYQAQLTRETRFAYGLDGPIAMFAAQIHQESTWNQDAKSPFASGLAQFTPATAEWISGVYPSLGPAQPLNPQWAMRAMLAYDHRLYEGVTRFKNECHRWGFGLSDYNGGSGRRLARQAKSRDPADYFATRFINPGISGANQRENQDYPMRILFRWQPVYAPWGPTVFCGIPFQAVS